MEEKTELSTKNKILKIALELFCENGYQNVSLREIANHVGIRHNTIMYYYGSKDGIALEIMMRFRQIVLNESARIYDILDLRHKSPYYAILLFNAITFLYLQCNKVFGKEYCIFRKSAEEMFIDMYGTDYVEASLSSKFPGFVDMMNFRSDEYTRIICGTNVVIIGSYLINETIDFITALYDFAVVYAHFALDNNVDKADLVDFYEKYLKDYKINDADLLDRIIYMNY